MAQINKPSDYFNTVLYTGNGSTQSITGVNFQPDWTWIKCRSDVRNHQAYDVVRGATKQIYPNLTNAEDTDASSLTSFDSDGFSLGSAGAVNVSGQTFASWNWLAGGTASSNTDGSITSQVSANTTSGFSIVSYTGTGSASTVGHGLSSAPKMIIVKKRDGAATWLTYNANIGNGYDYYLSLNSSAIANSADSTVWNNTNPTSTVFSLGNWGDLNGNGSTYIAYCFANVKGFSKFGSYVGNANADGTFVYTGFKPAFVLVKNTQNSDAYWYLFDNKRNSYNLVNTALYPNDSAVEGVSGVSIMDFVSNGFKLRGNSGGTNPDGQTMIYMAFAEQPLVGTNNISATAR